MAANKTDSFTTRCGHCRDSGRRAGGQAGGREAGDGIVKLQHLHKQLAE